MTFTELPAWKALQDYYNNNGKNLNLNELFAQDPDRFDKLNVSFGSIGHSSLPLILLDYSKNLVTDQVMSLLFQLVKETNVESWKDKMFHGDKINTTQVVFFF